HASGAKATARFTDLRPYSGAPSTGGPTDPTDPTEPTLPVDPVDPVDPTEPTEPGEPGAPGSRYTAPPATLYVATDGNDSNSGRSEDAPLRTLSRAASMVRPGDVVYIRGGTYPVEVQFR